jgi:hypothetical protein
VTRAGAAAVALLALALASSCRRAPSAVDAGPTGRPARPGECTAAPALTTGRLAIDWASETTNRLEVFPSGEIRQVGVLVARASGACVLDPAGGVLWSVGPDGVVTGPLAQKAGAIERRDTLRDTGGGDHAVGEVLVSEGWTTAVSTDHDGVVLLATSPGPPSVSRIGIEGDFVRARRLALVLLAFGSVFAVPDSAEDPAHPFRKRRLPRPKECGDERPETPAAFTVDLAEGARPRRVVVSPLGDVTEDGRTTARLAGPCVLDPQDGLVAAVTGGTARDGDGTPIGAFEKSALLLVDGGARADGETFVAADGSRTGVAPDGSLVRAAPGGPAVGTATRVTGDVAAARRTALLLLELLRVDRDLSPGRGR